MPETAAVPRPRAPKPTEQETRLRLVEPKSGDPAATRRSEADRRPAARAEEVDDLWDNVPV